ncbi:MAG TPA: branched-chain amino acid ABC transporter permease [Candidatus Baltobacteraceae bacterium]|nr:branched-chain amino acid ABC transporter permease [Candidatus Baltobacteraceae bacterium]
MHPELVAQLTVDGLLLGGVFALAALGLNVIFGVTRIVNLAHGEIIVLAALCATVVFQRTGLTPIELLPVMFVGGAVLGAILERLVFRRLPPDPAGAETTSLLLTFGVAYFMVGFSLAVFTADFRSVAYLTGSWQLGPISIGQSRFVAFVAAVLSAAALAFVLRATALGRGLRAASQNVDGARACGIDIGRMRTVSFALGSGVAATAGCLVSMIYAVNPDSGSQFTLLAFSVVALGGLGSYAGTLLGAAILGVAVSFAGFFASAQIGQLVPYVIFIAVLLFRPNGILGKSTA